MLSVSGRYTVFSQAGGRCENQPGMGWSSVTHGFCALLDQGRAG